jgi:aspartyl-tRNA(Asn)/glutamyl-tRNA(Gln) amidotransferase subunit C
MVSFDKEELLKIAKLSKLELDENEITTFASHLKTVLDYTSQLDNVKHQDVTFDRSYKINVFREDKVVPTDSKPLLEQAPQKKDPYFEVPKIL